MNNKIIGFTFSIVLGIIFSIFFLKKESVDSDNNYVVLIPIILVINGVLPYIFPSLNKIGFGTLNFYPNLFKKIFKK